MRVTMTTKNVELTSGFKTFVERKVEKLSKFASRGLTNIQILFDVDRKRKGADADAVIEMVGEINHKTVIVKEKGKNFYQAFFSALGTMQRKVEREKEKSRSYSHLDSKHRT